MIYFAQPKNGGPIRIGTTQSEHKRFTQLGTWIPGGIECVLSLPGGRMGEELLLELFAPIRVERDWFKSCACIWRFIIEASDVVPDWLPQTTGKAPKFDRQEITDEFGGLEGARKTLRYSSQTALFQAFSNQTVTSYALAARIMKHRLLKSRRLPEYIAEQHLGHLL